MMKVLHVLIFCPLLLLSLAGCGTAPVEKDSSGQSVANETKEEMVVRRSKEFWDARIAGDTKKAYEYLSSGSKAVLSPEEFVMKSSTVTFRAFKEEGVECEGEICRVSGFLTYDHPKMKGVSSYGKDVWIIEDGVPGYVFPK